MNVLILSRENTTRSQMAKALLVRELMKRGLETEVDVETAGTDPADRVPRPVKEVMAEQDVFLDDAYPTEVTEDQLRRADHVIAVGFRPELAEGLDAETMAWDIDDPGTDPEDLRAVRDAIADRVVQLLDRWQEQDVLGSGYNMGEYDGY